MSAALRIEAINPTSFDSPDRLRNFGEDLYGHLRDTCTISLDEIDRATTAFTLRDIRRTDLDGITGLIKRRLKKTPLGRLPSSRRAITSLVISFDMPPESRDPSLCRLFGRHAKSAFATQPEIKHTWSIDADEDHCFLEIRGEGGPGSNHILPARSHDGNGRPQVLG